MLLNWVYQKVPYQQYSWGEKKWMCSMAWDNAYTANKEIALKSGGGDVSVGKIQYYFGGLNCLP